MTNIDTKIITEWLKHAPLWNPSIQLLESEKSHLSLVINQKSLNNSEKKIDMNKERVKNEYMFCNILMKSGSLLLKIALSLPIGKT
jgi:hypothetical protein